MDGIFNPYKIKVPKKDFQSPIDGENPYDTEYGEAKLGNIKLDGDSYVLELQELDAEGIAGRLGELLKTVSEEHKDTLLRHGIELIPTNSTRQLEEGEVSLPTPDGNIYLFVSPDAVGNNNQTEVDAFRRITGALKEVPRELLVKHKARIIVRA
jgi:hypothetical protein